MNLRDTTVTALSRLSPAQATAKLLELVAHNMGTLVRQVAFTAALPPNQRCMRISSNLLPAYTHPVARPLYGGEPTLREAVERGLAAAGEAARAGGVRLSMHPAQFCVLATLNPRALENCIADIEYHTEIFRLMGLTGGWHPQGAHINVHGGARAAGVRAFREGLRLLSRDAQDLLTVENDEVAFGLEDLLPLADALPIVVDFHHHWVASSGERLVPSDPRLDPVRESWRGVRPMAHISAPRQEHVPGADPDRLPDFIAITAAGVSARDLRRHSDGMWNRAINAWAAAHLAWTDLEVEAKAKNLASAEFARAAALPSAGGLPRPGRSSDA